MNRRPFLLRSALLAGAAALFLVPSAAARAQGARQMTIPDLRAWKSIRGPAVSPDGRWLAYQLAPNDGDASVVIRATHDTTEWKFPVGDAGAGAGGGRGGRGGGSGPVTISGDSRWAMFTVAPTKAEAERARTARRPAESKVELVSLATGKTREFANIARFAFAGDHPRWLALYTRPPEAGGGEAEGAPAGGR
ncbi:MAG: PD40 domain-containing protein, partial [Gemmatimonadota bacterium]|nr:PD40 domain-containing protein [Gemmatimonadota bacterium]